MKVAVCFSGLIRTGCLCSKNLFDYFGDLDIDFFIHTWDYENQAYPLLDSHYRNTEIFDNISLYIPHKLQQSKIDKFLSLYQPKNYKIESYELFNDYRKSAELEGRLISPLWVSLNRSIELLEEYRNEYDYVVKIRPDLLIKPGSSLIKDIELLETYDKNSLLICNLGGEDQLYETCVFTDDVLFIARTDVMKLISKHGNPNNKTHEFFMRYLIQNNVKPYNAVTSRYTILRPHLVHLDTINDFEIIRKEEHLLYIPEELYFKMYDK